VGEVASPELSVVCRSCGQEVSPYVTECPYCGTRLRKRAPKLERKEGGELQARETRAERRRRKAAERRERRGGRGLAAIAADRPYATIAAIAAPALLLIVERATNLTLTDLGAIVGPVGSEWWRYLAAPWVFDDLGYLFCVAVALAIFMPAVEERVGTVPALLLAIACGSLGMLAADGIELAFGNGIPVAAGGNGVALGILAAWLVLRDTERRADRTVEYDRVAVAVAAAVLLLLPAVDDLANVWAGLAGALVGAACGLSAALGRRSAA
jgi:membrane associated rhomboid family serine protease